MLIDVAYHPDSVEPLVRVKFAIRELVSVVTPSNCIVNQAGRHLPFSNDFNVNQRIAISMLERPEIFWLGEAAFSYDEYSQLRLPRSLTTPQRVAVLLNPPFHH